MISILRNGISDMRYDEASYIYDSFLKSDKSEIYHEKTLSSQSLTALISNLHCDYDIYLSESSNNEKANGFFIVLRTNEKIEEIIVFMLSTNTIKEKKTYAKNIRILYKEILSKYGNLSYSFAVKKNRKIKKEMLRVYDTSKRECSISISQMRSNSHAKSETYVNCLVSIIEKNKFEDGNDPDVLLQRLGKVKRIMPIPFLEILKDEANKRKISLRFDVGEDSFDYRTNEKVLIYSEIFGGLGGLSLRSPDDRIKYALLSDAFYESVENDKKKNYKQIVLSSQDKYELKNNIENSKKILFLPGSNILKKTTSIQDIKKYVDLGFDIKLHPLTNNRHIEEVKKIFVGCKIYDSDESGFNLMLNANEVAGTLNSELIIYSILLEKNVHLLENPNEFLFGPHYAIIKSSMGNENNKRDSFIILNNILNSNMSGIFLPDKNSEKDIIDFLDKYEEAFHLKNEEVVNGRS
ncbi:MAG: hypothetical protein ACRC5T_13500 [Cetobacterium sp.]